MLFYGCLGVLLCCFMAVFVCFYAVFVCFCVFLCVFVCLGVENTPQTPKNFFPTDYAFLAIPHKKNKKKILPFLLTFPASHGILTSVQEVNRSI